MKKIKVEKKVICNLEKCYSIAPLYYQRKEHFLVAAEKQDPCYLFDIEGNLIDKVWDGPGGAMSMAQVPGTNGQFLSTYKFYSPNDSKEAKIVIVTPKEKGNWEMRTLVDLPHVHRFDILMREGTAYLIACTLKSGHSYKEDWSMPGKVYVARLPEDLSGFHEGHQLKMTVIKDSMLKNHGYTRKFRNGLETAIISCEEGVFCFIPPAKGEEWKIEMLLKQPVSDAVLVDLDQDGEDELCTLAPFHGEKVSIYKNQNESYQKVFDFPEDLEFSHAIFGGELCGQPGFIVGHRKGKRNLIAIRYDMETDTYVPQVLDVDCGPANVLHYIADGKDILISTNREINEVAMYTLSL